MSNKRLTEHQAYLAMITFLETYYERTKADDIGALLGDLQLDSDGFPFDSIAKHDWATAISKVVDG